MRISRPCQERMTKVPKILAGRPDQLKTVFICMWNKILTKKKHLWFGDIAKLPANFPIEIFFTELAMLSCTLVIGGYKLVPCLIWGYTCTTALFWWIVNCTYIKVAYLWKSKPLKIHWVGTNWNNSCNCLNLRWYYVCMYYYVWISFTRCLPPEFF